MSKITPYVGIKGTFVLSSPWIGNPGELYEITAIRTLSELARLGVDPKTSVYGAVGLVNGNGTFVWENEEKANPFILTLTGTNGNVITVPDTYIAGYPDTSNVLYRQGLVAIDLGLFPDSEDLTIIANDLAELASSRIGLATTAKIHYIPLLKQPTVAEHIAYEKVRKYERPAHISNEEEISELKLENASLRKSLDALKTRMENLGLLP